MKVERKEGEGARKGERERGREGGGREQGAGGLNE